jgi:hypothetical protein
MTSADMNAGQAGGGQPGGPRAGQPKRRTFSIDYKLAMIVAYASRRDNRHPS